MVSTAVLRHDHVAEKGDREAGHDDDLAGLEAPSALMPTPAGYGPWLTKLKVDIRSAQLRASVSVNRELVLLYWRIGRDILERQASSGWGSEVVDRLAHDLGVAFPEVKGFSPRNLKYMRAFAEAWPEAEIVQQAAAQLPWFHLCTLLDKLGTRPSATGTSPRPFSMAVPRRSGFDGLPWRSRIARYLVTRGRSRRGPCRAQFRSAPTWEHTPRRASSSPTGRVRAARGLFEHGMAHRRASLRGLALSPTAASSNPSSTLRRGTSADI